MKQVVDFLLNIIKSGDTLALCGELGTGKTTLSRLLINKLGYNGRVMSPSFIVCCEYRLNIGIINHLDFYRIGTFDELIDLGIEEIIDESYLTIIEWADMFESDLENIVNSGYKIILNYDETGGRNIEIKTI